MSQYIRIIEYDEQNNIVGTMLRDKDNEVVSIKKRLTKEQKYVINRTNSIKCFISENEGAFLHGVYTYIYPYMQELNGSNIDIIRMIILATYMGSNYKCYDKNNNVIKKSSLMKIWDIKNRKERNDTYKKLKDVNYIYEDLEGGIMINKDLFIKGGMHDWAKSNSCNTYTRIFITNIRDMYYNCKNTERKRLANFFKILPFVNFKYNILCVNPMECDEEKIQPLSWKELSLICGVDETNSSRFKKELMKLRIYNYEVIGQFETGDGRSIVVNPKVYYGGNDIDRVRYLYTLFRMTQNGQKN